METSNGQIALTPDLFEPVEKSGHEAERISGPPPSFWSDAWRRLRRNRIAGVAGGLSLPGPTPAAGGRCAAARRASGAAPGGDLGGTASRSSLVAGSC